MRTVQKALIVVVLLMISFAFYGCNRQIQKGGKQDKLHHMLTTLKNYEADAIITFSKHSKPEDGKENVIKMKQQAEVGGKYKLIVESPEHLKGYITSFDGEKIIQYSPVANASVVCKPSEARNQTLFSSFVQNYLKAGEIKKQKETLNGSETVTFELEIPGGYRHLSKEKIWFDEKKLIPLKLEIYDNEGNTMIEVEFDHFKKDTEINFNT